MIVTADDFGLAPEVNAAVETAHSNGILTAASLMIGAPAAADAVDRARRLHSLKVGLHIVLTDGYPVSPPSRLPNLVDRSGRFRSDMARSSVRIFVDPTVRRQVADEIAAQFEAFLATGLRLDHVDCHKHWHLHPTISGLILDIGQRYGMTALRIPSEPVRVLRTHREADVIEAFLGDFNLCRASQGPRPQGAACSPPTGYSDWHGRAR